LPRSAKHSRPSILVRVQSHPARRDLRKRLIDGLQGLWWEIHEHSSEPPNPWEGYKECLTLSHASVSHLCVIQDDAIVCKDFAQALQRVVEMQGEKPVCLFIPGVRNGTYRDAIRALKRREPFVRVNPYDFVPVVGMVWPIDKIDHFLSWAETAELPGIRKPWRSDDAVVGSWSRFTKQEVLACLPSIVDHPNDVPSLIGRPAGNWIKERTALHFDPDPLRGVTL